MRKWILTAVMPLLFILPICQSSWAEPLDVDVGYVDICDMPIAIPIDDDNKSAESETVVALYHNDIVLAESVHVFNRINESRALTEKTEAYKNPEVGWRN